jgi:tetratricopeptide (TPR) repeat protein
MEKAVAAAHNVDVGDYYFADKNYNGALMRYQDALAAKPQDLAIQVRIGRTFEKLNKPSQALEQYEAAQKLPGPQKWADEANSALKRLRSSAH